MLMKILCELDQISLTFMLAIDGGKKKAQRHHYSSLTKYKNLICCKNMILL